MNENFIPAAHYHFLTPFYEAFVSPFMGRMWQRIALEAAKRSPQGGSVVDLGCGPGSVLRKLRSLRADLKLTGTDIDPSIINIARKKAKGKGIDFVVAPIDKQDLPDRSIDCAISTLMFHHLPLATKRAAFLEAKRILKPGGTFLLCDFSVPDRKYWWLSIEFWKHLEPEIIPQLEGQLFTMAKEAHATVKTLRTFYGCVALHHLQFPTDSCNQNLSNNSLHHQNASVSVRRHCA